MEQLGVESNLKWPQGVKLEPGGEGIIDVIPSGIIIASYELPRSLLTEVEHTAWFIEHSQKYNVERGWKHLESLLDAYFCHDEQFDSENLALKALAEILNGFSSFRLAE